MDFKITKIKTKKDKIYKLPSMGKILPDHPETTVFNGRAGSGKSNLLISLLHKFYKNYFNVIHLFAGSVDEMFDKIKGKIIKHTNPKEFKKDLREVLEKQNQMITEKGINKSTRCLIIFEDMVNHKSFMKTPEFKQCYVSQRHSNCSVWLTNQYWNELPKVCRMNVMNVFYFAGNQLEKKILMEEDCPPKLTMNKFRELIDYATEEPYSFLTIFRKKPQHLRFRKNLDVLLKI